MSENQLLLPPPQDSNDYWTDLDQPPPQYTAQEELARVPSPYNHYYGPALAPQGPSPIPAIPLPPAAQLPPYQAVADPLLAEAQVITKQPYAQPLNPDDQNRVSHSYSNILVILSVALCIVCGLFGSFLTIIFTIPALICACLALRAGVTGDLIGRRNYRYGAYFFNTVGFVLGLGVFGYTIYNMHRKGIYPFGNNSPSL